MSKPVYDVIVAGTPRGRTRNDGKRWVWWMPIGGHGLAKTKNELIALINRHFRGNVVLKLAAEADTSLPEEMVRVATAPIAREEEYKAYDRTIPTDLDRGIARCEMALKFAQSLPKSSPRDFDIEWWTQQLEERLRIRRFRGFKRPARKVPDAN